MSNLEQWIERVNNAEWSDEQGIEKPYPQVQALARTWLRRLCVIVPEAANHANVYPNATPDHEISIEFHGRWQTEPVEFWRKLHITFMRDPESRKANRAECLMIESRGKNEPLHFNDIDNILHGGSIKEAFRWLYNYPEFKKVRYTTKEEFDAINERIRQRKEVELLMNFGKSQSEMNLL
jgi:hypothetical protein